MHAFDRRTDRQTDGQTDRQTDRQLDRILIVRPRLHSMQRGKNDYCWPSPTSVAGFSNVQNSAMLRRRRSAIYRRRRDASFHPSPISAPATDVANPLRPSKVVDDTEKPYLFTTVDGGTAITTVFFTALHGMQTRSSDENSVCLSVRPSVRLSNACIVTKKEESYV